MRNPPGAAQRSIVITGVTKGLGRALARQMAALGHRVFGCGRSEQALSDLARELGPPHNFTSVDVADWRQVRGWAERVVLECGAPDFLINNAALANQRAPLWRVPPEEFSILIDVNLKGVAHLVSAFVPAMVERRSGVVVNFSSGWGRSVSPEVAPYCASKWGIEGLTKALAEELPEGMAAVPLNPGVIHTEMLETCFGAEARGYPEPESWAEAAAPFILGLRGRDNGRSLTVPGF